jgi:hypothetical protein
LFGSGERLRAVYLDGGDGAEHLLHFRDEERGVDCAFADGGDGVVRCLPIRNVGLYYTDADCTEPVAIVHECDPPPPYVRSNPAGACRDAQPPPVEVWEVQAPLTIVEAYSLDDGRCVPITYYPDEQDAFAAEPADLGLFVEAELSSEELDGGLGRRVALASDGAYHVLGGYDAVTDASCNVSDVNGTPRCLGFVAEAFGYSTSPTCDVEDVAYTDVEPACGELSAVLQYTADADLCVDDYHHEFFELGAALEPAEIYEGSPTECAPVAAEPGRFFALGDPLSEDTFPHLGVAELGTGRLRKHALSTPGGVALSTDWHLWHRWRDTEREEDCVPQLTATGTRCLPSRSESTGGWYADAACTEILLPIETPICDLPPYVRLTSATPAPCSIHRTEHVHELGPEHIGPTYVRVGGRGGPCTEVTLTDTAVYSMGAEIPLDAFALIEQR